MKTKLLFCCLVMASLSANAQTTLNLKVNVEKGVGSLTKGDAVINSIYYVPAALQNSSVSHDSYFFNGVQAGKEFKIDCYNLPKRFDMEPLSDSLEDFWDVQSIKSLSSLSKLPDLYSIRTGIEEDAMSFISSLEQNGLVFDDPYLVSYLYSIVSKIAPKNRPDGFPYNLNIVIAKEDSMNACVYPNGTLVINTGLLANIHTEDELVAVIAHEIGHFASNHALINIQKAIQRKQRAEAFAAIATAIAATAEVYAASRGSYVDGSITFGTAVLSAAIAADVAKSLGTNFTKEQEKDADEMAMRALTLLGYDSNACATLFSRMGKAFNENGNWAAYYMSEDHPSLQERVEYCGGKPNLKRDPEFEKKISFAVTNAAIAKLNFGRFDQALAYVNQNIENGVATDDDLLIKAQCLMNLNNDAQSNNDALSLIQKAKSINPNNANIHKSEIIANLRLNRNSQALSLLGEYMSELNSSIESVDVDSRAYSYYANELDWARKMKCKVSGL